MKPPKFPKQLLSIPEGRHSAAVSFFFRVKKAIILTSMDSRGKLCVETPGRRMALEVGPPANTHQQNGDCTYWVLRKMGKVSENTFQFLFDVVLFFFEVSALILKESFCPFFSHWLVCCFFLLLWGQHWCVWRTWKNFCIKMGWTSPRCRKFWELSSCQTGTIHWTGRMQNAWNKLTKSHTSVFISILECKLKFHHNLTLWWKNNTSLNFM